MSANLNYFHEANSRDGQTEPLRAVWLDPTAPLADTDRLALAQAGWQIQVVQLLADLPALAKAAQAIIIRLRYDSQILEDLTRVMNASNLSRPIICRLDPGALDLALDVARMGIHHVVATNDWREPSWRRLAERLVNESTPPSLSSPADRSSATHPIRQHPRHVVFVDPASQYLLALAQRVAQAEVTALLVGPTGAGKEVLARVLHEASPRSRGPFIALNCAAMPEALIEDLLFGHEKGAFTSAHRDRKGLFEQAQGGTLFLDEIAEIPPHLQSKLLRVLQERELTRLGGQSSIRLDVRVIAATNKDLRKAIEDREFREDLYYRIATFKLRLLPLAERRGDILPLVTHCLTQMGRTDIRWQLTPRAQQMLMQYSWPGNVRELENVIHRATVLSTDGVIDTPQLMFDDLHAGPITSTCDTSLPTECLTIPAANDRLTADPPTALDTAQARANLQHAVKQNEHQIIMATLATSRSRNEAAERLGISPRTLRYKLARLRERGLNLALAD